MLTCHTHLLASSSYPTVFNIGVVRRWPNCTGTGLARTWRGKAHNLLTTGQRPVSGPPIIYLVTGLRPTHHVIRKKPVRFMTEAMKQVQGQAIDLEFARGTSIMMSQKYLEYV